MTETRGHTRHEIGIAVSASRFGRGARDEHARGLRRFRDRVDALASPESFASIADTDARSAAMFTELGKVLTHPRCTNCHPAERPSAARRREPAAPAAGRARRGWPWPSGDALFDLPSEREFRARPHAGPSGMASRAARDGVGGQDGCRNLRADQRPRAQRRTQGRRTRSTISAKIRWSAGPGRPASAAAPPPARKSRPARWSRPG